MGFMFGDWVGGCVRGGTPDRSIIGLLLSCGMFCFWQDMVWCCCCAAGDMPWTEPGLDAEPGEA